MSEATASDSGWLLRIGEITSWGPVRAICSIGGERYYFMGHGDGSTSMIPAFIVEGRAREQPANVSGRR